MSTLVLTARWFCRLAPVACFAAALAFSSHAFAQCSGGGGGGGGGRGGGGGGGGGGGMAAAGLTGTTTGTTTTTTAASAAAQSAALAQFQANLPAMRFNEAIVRQQMINAQQRQLAEIRKQAFRQRQRERRTRVAEEKALVQQEKREANLARIAEARVKARDVSSPVEKLPEVRLASLGSL